MFTMPCPSLYTRVEVEEKGLRSKEPKRGTKDATTIMAVVDVTFAEKES